MMRRSLSQLADVFRQIRFLTCLTSYRSFVKSDCAYDTRKVLKGNENEEVDRLLSAYRKYGHRIAKLNPLASSETSEKELYLNPAVHGLDSDVCEYLRSDLFLTGTSKKKPEEMKKLNYIYCSHIGIEADYLPEKERDWFYNSFESVQTNTNFSESERKSMCEELIKVQVFEKYLSVKFANVKRYGLEGAETMITFFQMLFQKCASDGLSDIVITSAHRGRLALLYALLRFPPAIIFRKMKGFAEYPENYRFTGDVLSHLRNSIKLDFEGKPLNVSMLPNPSHLEAASPVVVGKVRSMLQSFKWGDYSSNHQISDNKILAVQVHGDASFSGQGVIMETLAMSKVPNFRVGGCLHIIVNNQIGFTTTPNQGRSSLYCSDVIKMIGAPVIHVNGSFPEEVAKAAILALNYRQKFGKDVIVDLVCFRRHGHNEMDDPSFTNPVMYHSIRKLKPFPDLYFEVLQKEGVLTHKDRENLVEKYTLVLDENLKLSDSKEFQIKQFFKEGEFMKQASKSLSTWDTGIPVDLLKYIGAKSVSVPDHINLHPTLKKYFVEERLKKVESGSNIDWATAEALAVGSLLCQGYNVRLSGQDVGRGTFSHRHFSIVDQQNGDTYLPLNHICHPQKAFLEVANSILSEEAVLGFEYGFSIDNPSTLVMWEAQFGDFFNSAQVVFDTFISSGETKWLIQSGIVILLPHGYDGAGPEHSSCRMERFLQMCDSKENEIDGDDVNWCIVYPTIPSQIFHLLRKQMICTHKKPLIIVAPKVILRHPLAVSSIQDMSPGTIFNPVIPDSLEPKDCIKSLIFCSGKHYYALYKEREIRKRRDIALVRLEQLCPFPAEAISEAIRMFKNAQTFIWSQEEHKNMGPWSFTDVRFRNILGIELEYAGRKPLSTPAVGIARLHETEVQEVLNESFKA